MAENYRMKEEILNIAANPRILPAVKRLRVAGIIADELAKHNVKAIMVGGSAVEFYTHQQYATQDIDFVLNTTEKVTECMNSLGFINHGGVWECDQTPFIVEFPKGPLAGDLNRTNNIFVDDRRISIIGLEDIIIDRSLRGKYWEASSKTTGKNYREGFFNEWAKFIIEAHSDRLDWDYLRKRAKEDNCEDVIRHFQKRYKKELGDLDERNPKRVEMFNSKEYKEYVHKILKTDVGKISSRSSDYKVFVYFAKPILSLSTTWSHEDDILLLNNMCDKDIEKGKILKSLTYSPNFFGLSEKEKTIKALVVWKDAQSESSVSDYINRHDSHR